MELLHSNKLSGGGAGASTQKFVDVDEVRDGVIVLKNGSIRAVLLVSSVNFDLKSTEEQDGIINQYQNFINSVDFPLQISIMSRKLNINPYLEYLKRQEGKLTNELMQLQLSEYSNFIKNLAEVSDIMTKSFHIVIPFSPIENLKQGFFDSFFGGDNQKQSVMYKRELFDTYKNQLWQRVDHVIAGLSGIGLSIVPLKTEELIELLYNSYNPTTHHTTIIKNIGGVELS
jgi:hypothetical protein